MTNYVMLDSGTNAVVLRSEMPFPAEAPSGFMIVETEDWPREGAVRQDDGSFVNPEPTYVWQPRMPSLSDRQFGAGLWADGIITFSECDAFVSTGAIPAALETILDTLPDDDTGQPTPRKEAIILVKGAVEYRFDNPLVDLVRQAQGWSVEHLRERWTAWAAL